MRNLIVCIIIFTLNAVFGDEEVRTQLNVRKETKEVTITEWVPSATWLLVRWEISDPEIVGSISVSWFFDGESYETTINDPKQTSYVIYELLPDSSVVVIVTEYDLNSNEISSSQILAETLSETSIVLLATTISPYMVHLDWNDPYYRNDSYGYEMEYFNIYWAKAETPSRISGSYYNYDFDYQAYINDLEEFTQYIFWVIGFNSSGSVIGSSRQDMAATPKISSYSITLVAVRAIYFGCLSVEFYTEEPDIASDLGFWVYTVYYEERYSSGPIEERFPDDGRRTHTKCGFREDVAYNVWMSGSIDRDDDHNILSNNISRITRERIDLNYGYYGLDDGLTSHYELYRITYELMEDIYYELREIEDSSAKSKKMAEEVVYPETTDLLSQMYFCSSPTDSLCKWTFVTMKLTKDTAEDVIMGKVNVVIIERLLHLKNEISREARHDFGRITEGKYQDYISRVMERVEEARNNARYLNDNMERNQSASGGFVIALICVFVVLFALCIGAIVYYLYISNKSAKREKELDDQIAEGNDNPAFQRDPKRSQS